MQMIICEIFYILRFLRKFKLFSFWSHLMHFIIISNILFLPQRKVFLRTKIFLENKNMFVFIANQNLFFRKAFVFANSKIVILSYSKNVKFLSSNSQNNKYNAKIDILGKRQTFTQGKKDTWGKFIYSICVFRFGLKQWENIKLM